jgi:hypothetical protein
MTVLAMLVALALPRVILFDARVMHTSGTLFVLAAVDCGFSIYVG